jgi:integrase
MIKSSRFCRNIINKYTRQVVSIFAWGVENDSVSAPTWQALKSVRALPKGYPGTFDHSEREAVPKEVIEATLPFLAPVVAALVQVQYLTGMRPSEACNMRVGNINRSQKNGLWYYTPESHKTEQHIGKKSIPLSEPVQRLIAPYLIGKRSEDSVFSPRTAMKERAAEARSNRKSKLTPSQRERDAKRAEKKLCHVGEFYNKDSYRRAVNYAIEKGNRHGVKIPHWSPYLLRNSAATAIELEHGLDEAQAQLGHTSANMTKRYSSAQLKQREKIARTQRNPFDDGLADGRATG